jgi:glyoxylase-like metal-dependent hydrolase (beta-lactamase superfamily II)
VPEIAFRRDLKFEYETLETLSPLIRRVVARNPSPFTADGTATYIVGRGRVAVVDPGPALTEHVDALLHALRGETIECQIITHTHLDHSPAAAAVKAATGAKIYGFGPHGGQRPGDAPVEEGGDFAFRPDHVLRDGDVVEGPGWQLAAVHTPGHTSNHLCFALPAERTLFTGDHVMGWSTSVISPPDGDMIAYMGSLEKLLARDDALYRPTHGPAIDNTKAYVQSFIDHRRERSAAILARLAAGDRRIPEIVGAIYIGLKPQLYRAAGRSVWAHLLELVESGKVIADGPATLDATYRAKS